MALSNGSRAPVRIATGVASTHLPSGAPPSALRLPSTHTVCHMMDACVDTPVSPKTLIREIVDGMPDTATLAEIVDEIRLGVALEESMQDIREGNVISNAEMKARSLNWVERRK